MGGRPTGWRRVAAGLAAGWLLAAAGAVWAEGALRTDRPGVGRGGVVELPSGLRVASEEEETRVAAEVEGTLDQPFDAVARLLASPEDWCDVASLHLNTKACVHSVREGEAILRLYSGRKYYQAPEEAFPLDYRFAPGAAAEGRFAVTLSAPEGPLGTRDHRIEVEAVRAEDGTAVRFLCSYRPSVRSRWATALYLATLGRTKVGFSSDGRDEHGDPVPVGGLRGVVERNAVRYVLAMEAFLETRGVPGPARFEAMLGTWFDLAARYPALQEVSREEYLAAKRLERENRVALQRALDREAPGGTD
jgi:hypothetical protein